MVYSNCQVVLGVVFKVLNGLNGITTYTRLYYIVRRRETDNFLDIQSQYTNINIYILTF